MSGTVCGGLVFLLSDEGWGEKNSKTKTDGRLSEIKEIARRCYSSPPPEGLHSHPLRVKTSSLPSITIHIPQT